MYTSIELRTLNKHDVIPPTAVRKTIFSLRLWRPQRHRRHPQRHWQVNPGRRHSARPAGLTLGCVNARLVGNKSATLCHAIADKRLDVLVLTETWHENTDSLTLKRTTPPRYQTVDAARPITSDVAVHDVHFQNHGGLAFVFRDTVYFQKRTFDVNVMTFEYLYGFATTGDGHFIPLGIYRPGRQSLSATFYNELSAVLQWIAVHSCLIVICGDFNLHVDQTDDAHAVRFGQLLQSFGLVQQ